MATAKNSAAAEPVSAAPAPAAPWIDRQREQLLAQRGHAWLLQGPSGLGQFSLAMGLVRAWLCDAPTPQGACGHCASCHAIDVHAHTDLCVLMPETEMLALGWPLPEKAQADIDDKKRKPSQEIRVDAMRDAVEFTQRTSGRGKGKAVLVFPAEKMNAITANALLKTLEEPPGDARFVLATEAAHQLLPTIRSRCLAHTMQWPDAASARNWLVAQAVPEDQVDALLQAAGGRPDDALAQMQAGRSPQVWKKLPKDLANGQPGALASLSAPEVVDALQKLCHDLLMLRVGAAPRFFEAADLPPPPALAVLARWSKALTQSLRTASHPFNQGLMLEALVAQAASVLQSRR
ncbi:DNA polymerase III subunit delta' [Comamonas piscis]|uniref:DNA polymerase III subunit delta n=1 Tax=Comamonas piscis TaxID=1562974 RepID=A0A7G5EJL3_9BURK|nr:DNA polymerase III subunit delta' [Comamonas piscis]QMV74188.1 DNA polymerase III subunit delta' [Comamonas piscis]WSO32628.1 DNA polymerase III subunit delta' [Comamonas piscis]